MEKILVFLLEESRKYKYNTIEFYNVSRNWVPVKNFQPGTKLGLGNYRKQDSYFTTGYLIKLENVVIEKEALEKFTNIGFEGRLTEDKLTTIYQEEYKMLFLCYENKI